MRQYMKSKPARCGIKVWAAADVKTSYLYNLQHCSSKHTINIGAAAEPQEGKMLTLS
jgi:hypothetical protein